MSKRLTCLIAVLLALSVSYCSCSSSNSQSVVLPDSFLSSYLDCDFDKALDFTDSSPSLTRINEEYARADSLNQNLLKDIFSYISFEVVSYNSQKNSLEVSDKNTQYSDVFFRIIDFDTLISYVNTECASGISSKYEILEQMTDNQTISNYLKSKSISIKTINDGSGWVVSLGSSDNIELVELLGMNRFVSWILG